LRFWKQTDAQSEVRNGIQEVFPRLWRYCLVLANTHAQADDLAQSACLRALEKADQFKAGTHFDRWIFRLTQRIWIDELRKSAVRIGGGLSRIDEIELIDAGSNPEEKLMTREVLMAVMQLPEAQRTTVVLVYVEGYGYKETAEILDIPVGTVMSRLSVARAKLVSMFQNQAEVG